MIMAILVSILFSLSIGFVMGFFYHLNIQNNINKQYLNTIRKTVNNYLNDCDRAGYNKYVLTKAKAEILVTNIVSALNKLK
jgi:hypothetical protein